MTPQTTVPADETPADCPYCGRPFAREEYLTLHKGLDHYEDLSADEQEAFVEAYEAETEEIKLFRLKAVGLLVVIYFGFLFTYAIV
jgi:hypothetical protein